MRRLSLVFVIVAALLGSGSIWGIGATAQEASPEAAPGAIPALLVAWAEAWSSHDPEQVVALYAEDGVYEEIPTSSIARGHDEIREFVAATHAAFPNIVVTPRNGFQTEGWAVLEGDFAAESGDGMPFSVPFIVIMELEGDTIQRSADYFDLNAVLTQISPDQATRGATPEAGTPTA